MKWWIWTSIAGFLIGAALYGDATAHADPIDPQVIRFTNQAAPIICDALDQHPNITEVEVVLQDIIDVSGFTVDQSAAVVVLSVDQQCPRFLPLLRQFADAGRVSVKA